MTTSRRPQQCYDHSREKSRMSVWTARLSAAHGNFRRGMFNYYYRSVA
jgi:hypothetical protein